MKHVEKSVFLSYRRVDQGWAIAVFQELTKHGFDVFFDFHGIASGDFERVILENIRSRAHFLVLLTPSAMERCVSPDDWLRREIETALDIQRNIVPLLFGGFDFASPTIANQLSGKLALLARYNGLPVFGQYFSAAMERLRENYLSVALDAVLHPASELARTAAKVEQAAAAQAADEQAVTDQAAAAELAAIEEAKAQDAARAQAEAAQAAAERAAAAQAAAALAAAALAAAERAASERAAAERAAATRAAAERAAIARAAAERAADEQIVAELAAGEQTVTAQAASMRARAARAAAANYHGRVRLEHVSKDYRRDGETVTALHDVNLTIEEGVFLVVAGPPKSGKSTLLKIIGGFEQPTSGQVSFEGRILVDDDYSPVGEFRTRVVALVRPLDLAGPIGRVYSNLSANFLRNPFRRLTVTELIERELKPLHEISAKERRERAAQTLDSIGMSQFASSALEHLSEAEQYRLAFACAWSRRPKIVLVDGIPFDFDAKTLAAVLKPMRQINRRLGTTFVIATNNEGVIAKSDRLVRIEDGRIRRLGVRTSGEWALVRQQ